MARYFLPTIRYPYAKETLKLLTARGINFVFATGRHHVDVGQIRDNLEIKSYMITSNGARVHDLDGNLILLITWIATLPAICLA